jgi:hypothetical protein
MHFDPVTGADRSSSAAGSGQEQCVRACYDCLLSYGNQGAHEMIDRHLVRDLMLQLAAANVTSAAATTAPSSAQPRNPRAAQFVAWLQSRDLRLPDDVDTEAHGTCPDLIYRLPDGNVAVFFTGPGGPDGTGSQYGDNATEDDLRDIGWGVIIIGADTEWAAITARYLSVFGSMD